MTNIKPLTKKGKESTTNKNLDYGDLSHNERYIFDKVDDALSDLLDINLKTDYVSITRILRVLMNKYGDGSQ